MKKFDFLESIEREPEKIENRISYEDLPNRPYCTVFKQVIGPYYLLVSLCDNCPLNNECNYYQPKNGWIFLDNLPDRPHDMPCFNGYSGRDVIVMTNKKKNQTIVSGNYHPREDFCKFILDIPEEQEELTAEQMEIVNNICGYPYEKFMFTRRIETEDYILDTIELSVLEPLPTLKKESVINYFKFQKDLYYSCVSKLPSRYTIFDYYPSRKLNFLKMYIQKASKAIIEYADCEEKIWYAKKRIKDIHKRMLRIWEIEKKEKNIIDNFCDVRIKSFSDNFADVLRRNYKNSFNAALLNDNNPDYQKALKLFEYLTATSSKLDEINARRSKIYDEYRLLYTSNMPIEEFENLNEVKEKIQKIYDERHEILKQMRMKAKKIIQQRK